MDPDEAIEYIKSDPNYNLSLDDDFRWLSWSNIGKQSIKEDFKKEYKLYFEENGFYMPTD